MRLECMDLEIKEISEDDLFANKNAIIDLLEDNFKINFPDIGNLTESAINGYEDMVRFKKDKSAILFGAFKGKEIKAFLWAYKRVVFKEMRIHISHIVVHSSLRSCGIGSRLLMELDNLCSKEGIKKIELVTSLDNKNAIKFYKSKGFSEVRVQLEKNLGENINDNRKSCNK